MSFLTQIEILEMSSQRLKVNNFMLIDSKKLEEKSSKFIIGSAKQITSGENCLRKLNKVSHDDLLAIPLIFQKKIFMRRGLKHDLSECERLELV